MSNKSNNKTAIGTRKRAVRRFPRLSGGAETAAFGKLIWKTPEFDPRVDSNTRTIDFIFRVHLEQPLTLKRYRSLHWILFGPASKSWEKSFQIAYSRLRYGDKSLEHSITNHLHPLFLEGVRLWLDEAWSLKEIAKPSRQEELTNFSKQTFNKNGGIKPNQPDPRVAMWTAHRERQFRTALPALRARLKNRAASMDDAELCREIAKVVPLEIFLSAWRHLAQQPNITARAFFAASWLSDGTMVKAMLTAELQQKGYDCRKISLKKYLKQGRELLRALLNLPKLQRFDQ